MTRFVVCGETLIDLIRSPDGPQDAATSTWSALSAGGPMNSAVALGRLGVPTHFLGRLSTDTFGQQLRRYIDGARVQLDLAVESSQATSLAIVSLDQQGVASYTFHFAETANFGWQPDELPALIADDWLHIASLSCVVSRRTTGRRSSRGCRSSAATEASCGPVMKTSTSCRTAGRPMIR
jgi:fructokinase